MKRIASNLSVQVLVAIGLGVLVGAVWPKAAVHCKVLADIFVTVIKWFVIPIIFCTVSLGVAGAGNLRQAGRIGLKALVYFEVITTIALLIGILVAELVRPGAGISGEISPGTDVSAYATGAQNFTWRGFFWKNPTLQVLGVSLLFGIVLGRMRDRMRIVKPLEHASRWVFRGLSWVTGVAPLGAFGGMAFTVGKFGLSSLLPLGRLMLAVYLTMGLFIFGVLGLVLRWCGVRIFDYFRLIREEILIVLGTSSSEAALPQLMNKLERFGCPPRVVGLVVPAGYSFNLDGTTLYLSMAVMFLVQVYRVHLEPGQIVALITILMVTSKGAAGVTGSGFVTLASTLLAVKLVPVEGLALLIGVDRFMSEARSITNLIGNGVATLAVARSEGADFTFRGRPGERF
ncbi:MAG: cation:dicarboxylase symporter family transporter [Pedosphaera sp.]|nr:cation:dicarboxylase symporter family transporter [Pedosphaera sp.]